MRENTQLPTPAECRDHFRLVDRLQEEFPDLLIPLRPFPNAAAYVAATRSTVEAMIAVEESTVDLRSEGEPNIDAAIPSLAALLVQLARRGDA